MEIAARNSSATDTARRWAIPALFLLLLINLVNYIDRYMMAALEPPIQAQFFPGNPPNAELWMGMLGTAFTVCYMVLSPLFGYLADRKSRWAIVGGAVVIWSLATGGSGLAATFGGFSLLFATRIFVGVGESGYGPTAPTLISDYFSIRRRGIVMAIFYMAIPLGSALGFIIGGAMARRHGWPSAFFVVFSPGLVLGILCFFMKDPPRGQADRSGGKEPTMARASEAGADSSPKDKRLDYAGPHTGPRSAKLADYMSLLRTPSYLLVTGGMAAMTFAVSGISYWLPRYIVEIRQVGDIESVNFKIGAITAGCGIVATLLGGAVGDILGRWVKSSYFLVSGIGMLIAVPFVVLLVKSPFPTAWVFVAIAEFFLFFNTGPTNTILANVAHPEVRATAFALNIFVIHVFGDAIAQPLLGKIGHSSWNAAFYLVAGVVGLAGLLWTAGCFYLHRDTQRALQPMDLSPGAPKI